MHGARGQTKLKKDQSYEREKRKYAIASCNDHFVVSKIESCSFSVSGSIVSDVSCSTLLAASYVSIILLSLLVISLSVPLCFLCLNLWSHGFYPFAHAKRQQGQ
jgi:hypothetical protein